MNKTIYDFEAVDNSGKVARFADFRDRVLLVVNTASKCGFTPQYKGLQALHEQYRERGFSVVGFPCDQFGHQEPGTDEEIRSFCERNFGVSFPLMRKIEVNGSGTHPIFAFLKDRAASDRGADIRWNFTKFLILRDGRTISRFEPNTEPSALAADIEKALGT